MPTLCLTNLNKKLLLPSEFLIKIFMIVEFSYNNCSEYIIMIHVYRILNWEGVLIGDSSFISAFHNSG
jgi:hypothetical protein